MNLTQLLFEQIAQQGFTLSGVAQAMPADTFVFFERWLNDGMHGEMDYLEDKKSHRQDPRKILNTVKSVVMVGLEYVDEEQICKANENSFQPLLPANFGRVAKYAQGPDYHRVIWEKLNVVRDWLIDLGYEATGVADTAPLLERDFARRAGLGWVGKNTMLINPRRGSFFFLGGLLTSAEFEASQPFTANHCGSCTACLDACPTNAFPAPGILDARKCISYLTIELRNQADEELRDQMGDWLQGCDICQDVCPWNRFAGQSQTNQMSFPHDPNLAMLDCVRLLSLTDEQYRYWFKHTSFFRTKRSGLLRNAAYVLGNIGDASCLPALEKACEDADIVIRDASLWAIKKVRQRLQNSYPSQ